MKRPRLRVQEVSLGRYEVQQKGWFFWHNIRVHMIWGVGLDFTDKAEAIAWMDKAYAALTHVPRTVKEHT